MLAAGSVYKIHGTLGSGYYGDTFSSATRISGSAQIDEYDGAGKFNVRNSRNIARSGNFWREKINSTSFPFSETVGYKKAMLAGTLTPRSYNMIS